MAQYGRPDSDVSFDACWSGTYLYIDEETYSDSDYLTCDMATNGDAEVGLSNVTDPASGSGHTVRFRAWQQNTVNQRTLQVELLQGSTVISTYSAFNLPTSATSYSWTLTSTEADNITDYTDLRLRFTAGGNVDPPGKNQAAVYVSWAELEVPDASGSALVKMINETEALTEATARPRAIVQSVSDTLAATEQPGRPRGLARPTGDTLASTEDTLQATASNILQVLEDSLSITEALASPTGLVRTVADTLAITEALGYTIAQPPQTTKMVGDTVSLTETVDYTLGTPTAVTKIQNETVGITEAVDHTIYSGEDLVKIITETVGITETTLGPYNEIIKIQVETVAITETTDYEGPVPPIVKIHIEYVSLLESSGTKRVCVNAPPLPEDPHCVISMDVKTLQVSNLVKTARVTNERKTVRASRGPSS